MSIQSGRNDAEAIRMKVMRLHGEVRDAVRDVARLAPRARRGDSSCQQQLPAALKRLADAMRDHEYQERELLDPFLETVDAWGTVRVERLQTERAQEARMVESARGLADPQAQASAACGVVRPLMRLLRREEREALAPEVLRDDVIAINQQDG